MSKQDKAEKMLDRKVQQAQVEQFKMVRASALTMAEYEHGRDKHVVDAKKSVVDAQNVLDKLSLDIAGARDGVNAARATVEAILEEYIPEPLRMLKHMPKPDPDATCSPCNETKDRKKAEQTAAEDAAEHLSVVATKSKRGKK